ncbi:MAG: hypothetical protein COB07_03020 [Sulfurovum sp.]|nr:MAG: hypothetical protein COB07_03020 [Sulfurovum sp.]
MITLDQIPMLAVPSMNDRHLEESLIINRLEVAVANNDIDEVYLILRELLEHTGLHYFDEEALMEETLFPTFKTHKKEHDRHLGELRSVIEYFDKHKDPRAVSAYIEGSLSAWTLHHADTMDRMLALFLEERATNASAAAK